MGLWRAGCGGGAEEGGAVEEDFLSKHELLIFNNMQIEVLWSFAIDATTCWSFQCGRADHALCQM
jgi:hypothetical protein